MTNEKVKIAILGHKRIPSRGGGIEIVVEELSVRMAKLGHQVTIYNRSGHHVSGKEFDAHRLKDIPSLCFSAHQAHRLTLQMCTAS